MAARGVLRVDQCEQLTRNLVDLLLLRRFRLRMHRIGELGVAEAVDALVFVDVVPAIASNRSNPNESHR